MDIDKFSNDVLNSTHVLIKEGHKNRLKIRFRRLRRRAPLVSLATTYVVLDDLMSELSELYHKKGTLGFIKTKTLLIEYVESIYAK